MKPRAAQLKFEGVSGHGGKRRGAGRPNRSGGVNHMKRNKVDFKKPLHLTLKFRDKKLNLRCREAAEAFKISAVKARKFGLRLLHFSLQVGHAHLIVETKDNDSLAAGMRSFGSSFGKAIRKIVGGRGPVFSGRYHITVIENPTQMRNTLAYVLQNYSKHGRLLNHFDEYSTAGYFRHWKKLLGRKAGPILEDIEDGWSAKEKASPLPDYLCAAQSWLAREGWMRARAT